MSTLLVQGCSKSKKQTERATPAIELYSGYFFKIIKKAIREREMAEDVDICILSAKHGLIDTQTPITTYDLRMDAQRAQGLSSRVSSELSERSTTGYDRVVLNLGETYRIAVREFVRETRQPVYHIDGGGIGEKGHSLKRFIRGDDSGLEQYHGMAASATH